ncbi:hypothetical protein AFK68_11915 [Hydrocoleum sp. CS-953]|nr:hypothetical protein AFK68_11915 [Hydrocoleum sp. CS-953]
MRYKIFLFVKDWKSISNSGNTSILLVTGWKPVLQISILLVTGWKPVLQISILLVTGWKPVLQITVPHHPQKCCKSTKLSIILT